MAEECIKWAGEAYTDEVRESYLQLARIWLDTASRLNGVATAEVGGGEPAKTADSAGDRQTPLRQHPPRQRARTPRSLQKITALSA